MPKSDPELDAMSSVHEALAKLEVEQQRRVLGWVVEKLGLTGAPNVGQGSSPGIPQQAQMGRPAATGSPKQFVAAKKPESDIERAAVLAYFLTHERGMTEFKTSDISAINKEAAQRPFANTAYSANNATAAGYLAPAGKKSKQITTRGEALVEAMPDRAAVKAALDANPVGGRRRAGGKGKKKVAKV